MMEALVTFSSRIVSRDLYISLALAHEDILLLRMLLDIFDIILITTHICVLNFITSPPGMAVSLWSLYGGLFIKKVVLLIVQTLQEVGKFGA